MRPVSSRLTHTMTMLVLAALTAGAAEARGGGGSGGGGIGGGHGGLGGVSNRPGSAGRGFALASRNRSGFNTARGFNHGSGFGASGFLPYGYGYGFGGFGGSGAGYGSGDGDDGRPRAGTAYPGYVATPGIRESPVLPPAVYVIGDPKKAAASARSAVGRPR